MSDLASSAYPHLPNAPIVEALIDLRVKLSDDFDVESLRELHNRIGEYPRLEEQHLVEGRLHFSKAGIESRGRSSLRGFRMISPDGKNIAQFRMDGFTFNRLQPYPTWTAFFAEAWRLWQLYRANARPAAITRLATRYVNRVKCPSQFRTEEYLHSAPQVPDGLPDVLLGFLYRYTLAPVDDVVSLVTLTTEPFADDQEYMAIVLDIDCHVRGDFQPDDEDTLRATFSKLRNMKNQVFFKTFTDKAKESFK